MDCGRSAAAAPRLGEVDHSWFVNFKWAGVPHRHGLDSCSVGRWVEDRSRDRAGPIFHAIRDGTFPRRRGPSPRVVAPDQLTSPPTATSPSSSAPCGRGSIAARRAAPTIARAESVREPARAQGLLVRCRSARSSRPTSKRRCGRCEQKAARTAPLTNTGNSVRASRSGGRRRAISCVRGSSSIPMFRREDLRSDQRHRRLQPDMVTDYGVLVPGESAA